jgi:hypothetical protein
LNRSFFNRTTGWFGVLLVAGGCAVIAWPITSVRGAEATELVSHRALYSVRLSNSKSHAGLVEVQGAMQYRFVRGCDGWLGENRSIMRFMTESDNETESTWSLTSWEALDGSHMRFRVREAQNGTQTKEVQGEATLNANGGHALFVSPKRERLPLASGTLFPTAHLIKLLQAAEAGRTLFGAPVFDGSTDEYAFDTNTLIAPVAADIADSIAKQFQLPAAPMWWFQMSFHGPDPDQGLPEFEIGIRYRRDGIADRVIQDFSDFAIELRLVNLERLPKTAC